MTNRRQVITGIGVLAAGTLASSQTGTFYTGPKTISYEVKCPIGHEPFTISSAGEWPEKPRIDVWTCCCPTCGVLFVPSRKDLREVAVRPPTLE